MFAVSLALHHFAHAVESLASHGAGYEIGIKIHEKHKFHALRAGSYIQAWSPL